MAEIKGMGNCGICQKPIQDPKTGIPSPVRHFKDYTLAHKACFDAWTEEDAQRDRLKNVITRTEAQIAAMQDDLERAKAALAALS
jgi:hypothetical protein